MPTLAALGDRLTLAAISSRITRWRWGLALVGALQAVDPIYLGKIQSVDLIRFSRAGGAIVAGHLPDIYSTSWMQGGPFELLASWVLFPFGSQHRAQYIRTGLDGQLWLRLVIGAAITAGLMLGGRHLRAVHHLSRSARMELTAGLTAVLVAVPYRFWIGGHFAEFAVPLMWIYSTSLAVRGRPLLAGLLIGLSAGWEPWGVLAAGVLLVERNPRRLAAGCAAFAGGALACYLPFVLAGPFAMFDLQWPILRGSLVGRAFPHMVTFSWQLRLIQGLASGLAGAVVAFTLERRRDVIWLAPLSVVVVRLILDPMNLDYYWMPVMIAVIAGVGLLHLGCSPDRVGLVTGLAIIPVLQLREGSPWSNTPWLLLVAVVLIVPLVVLTRREEPGARPEPARETTREPAGRRSG